MGFYVSLFKGEITRVEKYGPGEPGKEGTVKKADFTLAGHRLACIDSPVKHAFTFTPATSLFVECADEAELDAAFAQLLRGRRGAHAAGQLRVQPEVRVAQRPLRSVVATQRGVNPSCGTVTFPSASDGSLRATRPSRAGSSGSPGSCGQPLDTASMSFESGASISWMTVSLTDSPCGSSSYVSREKPSRAAPA